MVAYGKRASMVNIVTIFVTSFVVGLSGAMMPGPVLTVAISETNKKGFWAGPLIVLGHAVLELSLVIGLVMGLGQVLGSAYVTGSIAIGGSIFLLWMGWDITKSAINRKVVFETEGAQTNSAFGPVVAGITVSLSNPYWSIWWVTVGAGFVLQSLHYKFLGLASFYSGHILSDLFWYSLVSLAVVTGKKILSDRIYQAILVFCGLFLIGLSLFFAYSGIKFIT